MKVVIYDNFASISVTAGLRAVGKMLMQHGIAVKTLNPNPFQPGMEDKNADVVIVPGGGEKHELVRECYRKIGVRVIAPKSDQISEITLADVKGELPPPEASKKAPRKPRRRK